ncbi:hypothetical protein RB213_001357 [Colletotrichum asianum]
MVSQYAQRDEQTHPRATMPPLTTTAMRALN